MTEQPRPTGFNCKTCDTFHPFGGYMAAHWREELSHTCDTCGARHSVRRGRVRQIEKGTLHPRSIAEGERGAVESEQ